MAKEPEKPAKTDPAPHPIPAGPGNEPASPARGPAIGTVSGTPTTAPAEPITTREQDVQRVAFVDAPGRVGPTDEPPTEPVKKSGRTALVWAQPGHETIGVGAIIRVPADEAENLRRAGRARYASELEVKNAGERIAELTRV